MLRKGNRLKIVTAKDNFFSEIIPTTTNVLTTICAFNADIKSVEEFEYKSGSFDTTKCLDITGTLGFSSSTELIGSILMTFQLGVALEVIGGMYGFSQEEAKSDVEDGVSEFMNIVTGNIKTKLREQGIVLYRSIPNVITGKEIQISVPKLTSRKRIGFESKQGHFFFEIAFKEGLHTT